MSGQDIFFLVFTVLGGLALFIFGMNVMTDGLRSAAGSSLRTVLSRATDNRISGIMMGTILGTLVQSSATTVMLVGFINAGLMTLAQSIPPMLGANIGTTLSMQLIAFRLGDYCFLAIAAGLLLEMAAPSLKAKHIGRSLMGFGLILLGMNIMSDAIKPHRDLFAQILHGIHGQTIRNMMLGTLLATAVTAIIQSSGAVVIMCFTFFSAGVFTTIEEAYPIVLGARIGTCATALLGSMGTNIEARRSAVSHLVFNILTTIAAILAAPIFFKFAAWSSDDLIRQTANLNTAVAGIGALIFLAFSPLYARFVRVITPSKIPPPQPSHLDKRILCYPERALYACIQELQRVTHLCAQSLRLTFEIIFTKSRKAIQQINLNEEIVDEIKVAMKDYLRSLTHRALSRRQSILVQSLNRCITDIERIGDHIDELSNITQKRHKTEGGRFSGEQLEQLMALYEAAAKVLHLVIESLNPELADFQEQAQKILKARDEYMEHSLSIKAAFTEKIANHEVTPVIAIFMSEYISALDRIVRHAKMIALVEKLPYFWIKREKLSKMVEEKAEYNLPPRVDPNDFLQKLHTENYK